MNKEEQVLTAFRELFNKMNWLNKSKMEISLKGNKPSEVHCIEYIGTHADANVTKLAEALYMTRGRSARLHGSSCTRGLSRATRNRTIRRKSISDLLFKGWLYIRSMTNCTVSSGSGTDLCLSR